MAEIQMKIVYAYCFVMSEIVVIPLAFYYICTFFSCLVLPGVGYHLKCKQNVLTCHSQLYWADNTYFWRQSHVIMDFLLMMHIISRWSGKCLVWVRSFKILFLNILVWVWYIIVHVLNEGHILCWDFMPIQSPPHHIPWYLVISLLQVNENHVYVLLLSIPLHDMSY